VLVHTIGQ